MFALGLELLGRALLPEFIGDYVAALTLGILFQYFAIAPMRGLGFRKGLVEAAKADVLSLTAFEVGLFGWMAVMSFVLFPSSPLREHGRLLVSDAGGNDHRIRDGLAGERLADPSRH